VTARVPSPRDTLAQRLRDQLTAYQDVREVRMFGGLSFMVNQRMAVAAGRDGDLLVRTDPAEYDNLLRHGGEPAFMGDDRPMGRGWLTVPRERIRDDAQLAYWVEVGIESRGASS
jgi:TfoX/Sxy family transcriptional regulator of competence genes